MIRLTDAAKFYRELPHQLAAWNALQESLTADQLRLFEETYRSGPQEKRTDLGPALQLIKEFEGCRLSAYPDPASGDEPWTIGYGSSRYPDGRKVGRGNKITIIEADLMLRMEVDRIAEVLRTTVPHWGEMNANQQSALVSFAYNLGAKFYGSAGFETISKRLREKDWAGVPDALQLYRNRGSAVEAGLLRRRKAEGELWLAGKPQSNEAAKSQSSAPAKQQNGALLRVAYEAQNDNASGTGYRECFSSSAAMVARFYGKIASDDAYNKFRAKYGDTTDSQAQIKALQALGLNARLVTNANAKLLEKELAAGRPVMVGWLHKGPVTAPSGGGHWSVCVGHTDLAFIHNDPNGEADLINGGYVNHTKGAGIVYSRKNWLRRWEVDGPNTGWAMLVSPAT